MSHPYMSGIEEYFFLSVFLHSKQVISKRCAPFLLAVYGGTILKASKLSKNICLKLSTALCGIIQGFLIVSLAQYFPKTVTSAQSYKIQHRFSILCCGLRIGKERNLQFKTPEAE